jgi:hypothetical protein
MSETLNTTMEKRGLVSVAVAAERSGYTAQHLGRLLRSGEVQGERVVRRWFVSLASLAKYLGPEASKALGLAPKGKGR